MADKDKDMSLRCHWDGDFSSWPDYVRKVRLAYEKTRKRRRPQLGPELVSQLSGRAWIVTQEIDHRLLTQPGGARYLITFLEERLARVPIPDAGSQAENLLLRLRRTPGTSMATWCHQVREAYRKLQRALRRARGDLPDPKDDGAAPSHASSRARSGPEPAAEDDTDEEPAQDDEGPQSPSRPASSPKSRGKGKTKDHGSPFRGSRGSGGSSSEDEDFSTLWDDLDLGLPEVLPTELTGWIMLRKSALNAAQRLNVLSSMGNSLKAEDVERGLRGAEDELRLVEREREGRPKGHSKGKRRNTFWIEQDDQWGILLTEEADTEDILEQNEVHWLSTNAMEQAFPAWELPPLHRPDLTLRTAMAKKMVSLPQTLNYQAPTSGGIWKVMVSTTTRTSMELSGHGVSPKLGTQFCGVHLMKPSPWLRPMRPTKRR